MNMRGMLWAVLAMLAPTPAWAGDIGIGGLGFVFWSGSVLLLVPVVAALAGRWVAPSLPVPRRAWAASVFLWMILASVAGGFGLPWLWVPLLALLLVVGNRLARRSGWEDRPAWRWSLASFGGLLLYLLLGGVAFRLADPWSGIGYLTLIVGTLGLSWWERRSARPLQGG